MQEYRYRDTRGGRRSRDQLMESWDFVQNIIKDIFKTAFFSLLKREARFYLLEDLKKTEKCIKNMITGILSN